MKKIISLALATAMVFTMGAVAFAANSPSVESITPTVEDSTGLDNPEVTGSTLADVEVMEGFGATEIASIQIEGMMSTGFYSDVSVYGFEITADDVDDGGSSITLAMDGISASDLVSVYHFYKVNPTDDYYNSEGLPATAGDGTLTISDITSLSPFMVIVATPVVATTTPTTTTTVEDSGYPDGFTYDYPYGYWDGDTFVWNGYFDDAGVFVYTTDVAGVTTSTASPKTGETNAAAVAACMMLFAGVAVCGLVRKEQL